MKIIIQYSGGKDSQSCLIWSVKKWGAENIEVVFCDTGWESPVTYNHIVETTSSLGIVPKDLSSKKYQGFVDLVAKKKRKNGNYKRNFKSLNIFDMANMKIKQHENGFSLWMLEPCDDGKLREKCLIDGSLVKESGEIKLNNREHRMFKSIYDKDDNSIKIIKSK